MALAAPDPALSALWLIQVPFNTSVKFLAAESVTATFPKIPAEARFAAGEHVYVPGFKDIDGISITFYETDKHEVSEWLMKWQRLVFYKGVYGSPPSYKKQVVVSLYSVGRTKPTRILTYKNVWPTDRGPYELTYSEETGRLVVQGQFSVDGVDERS